MSTSKDRIDDIAQIRVDDDAFAFAERVNTLRDELQNQIPETLISDLIVISKNDSMNKRVEQIINLFEKGKHALIVSKPGALSKSVAITEIAKQKLSEKCLQVMQFNKIYKHLSTIGKFSKSSDQISSEPKNTPTLANIKESIHGPKVFTLPILCSLLTSNTSIKSINGWTSQ